MEKTLVTCKQLMSGALQRNTHHLVGNPDTCLHSGTLEHSGTDEIPIWEMLREIDNYFECIEISCFIILITWCIDIATCMYHSYIVSSVRNVWWESFVIVMYVWARQVDSLLSRNFRLWFTWPILDTYTKTRWIWRSESYLLCLYCSGLLLKLQQSFWGLLEFLQVRAPR